MQKFKLDGDVSMFRTNLGMRHYKSFIVSEKEISKIRTFTDNNGVQRVLVNNK